MSENSPPGTSALVAGLFLLVRDLLSGGKSLQKIRLARAALTGASKSEVYEIRDRLLGILPIVLDDSRWDTPTRCDTPTIKVMVTVRDYLMQDVEAVSSSDGRCTYSDGFRRCIVALADSGQPGETMSLAELEYATGVPEDTLKDWLGSQASPGTP